MGSFASPTRILLVTTGNGVPSVTHRSLSVARLRTDVNVVKAHEATSAYFRDVTHHGGDGRPDLVLLDATLSDESGRDVISVIRSEPGLKGVPVIVLRDSEITGGISRYSLHSKLYTMTPSDLELFLGLPKVVPDPAPTRANSLRD